MVSGYSNKCFPCIVKTKFEPTVGGRICSEDECIAYRLGFSSFGEMKDFFNMPAYEIWGQGDATYLFSSSRAYVEYPDIYKWDDFDSYTDVLPKRAIRHKFEMVAKRLRSYNPEDPDNDPLAIWLDNKRTERVEGAAWWAKQPHNPNNTIPKIKVKTG